MLPDKGSPVPAEGGTRAADHSRSGKKWSAIPAAGACASLRHAFASQCGRHSAFSQFPRTDSIFPSSSFVNARFRNAPTASSICSTLLAPMSAEVIPLCRNTQASAI